ncbi:hypothetical protein [Chlorogloeopsis fritschii]|uniref:hypothetical protein n=1 Tax=Chlorogloeopsis fritschii TaxID=1124 RepID=UPI000F8E0CCD|nr:hypothetical protein [Chlorogloeopsis fritschii]
MGVGLRSQSAHGGGKKSGKFFAGDGVTAITAPLLSPPPHVRSQKYCNSIKFFRRPLGVFLLDKMRNEVGCVALGDNLLQKIYISSYTLNFSRPFSLG